MKFATFQLKSVYDTVSDVVEKKVQWGSDFQSGSRVIKKALVATHQVLLGTSYHCMSTSNDIM